MKKYFVIQFLLLMCFSYAQKLEFQTLLKDKISIRAIQIWNNRVYYAGTYSKLGYVSLKDTIIKSQKRLSEENLQFRTLAQTKDLFYLINIESPAHFFKVTKKNLITEIVYTDSLKTAFYDALIFDKKERGVAISDPEKNGKATFRLFSPQEFKQTNDVYIPNYKKGEAHFAASNSNIAMKGNTVWIATGGTISRIFKFSWEKPYEWKAIETPFVRGEASGIYSIDFFDEKFGIAVGGDYTKQAENINNIATTFDGGETWQIQASGKNGGYKTCVKIRPKSKGKDIIAVGDQNIEFSSDFGKTWTTISKEKNLYVCEWIDENTLVFAGKDKILKAFLID